MRLMLRHVARDGLSIESEVVVNAKNPMVASKVFAHDNYIAVGERIDVLMLQADEMLNYEVTQSRIDPGGCRTRFVGKGS